MLNSQASVRMIKMITNVGWQHTHIFHFVRIISLDTLCRNILKRERTSNVYTELDNNGTENLLCSTNRSKCSVSWKLSYKNENVLFSSRIQTVPAYSNLCHWDYWRFSIEIHSDWEFDQFRSIFRILNYITSLEWIFYSRFETNLIYLISRNPNLHFLFPFPKLRTTNFLLKSWP